MPVSYTVFILASLAMLAIPGPAVAYIVARSVEQGRTAGIVSALGLAAGSVVLVMAAAFGLSALLASSPRAYSVIRYAGAAYLVWLGVRILLAKPANPDLPPARVPLRRIFAEGIVVNLLNPKTALFFFAFLPQFVDPRGNVRAQLVLLGLTFTFLGVVTDSIYATLAGWLGRRATPAGRAGRVRQVAVATVYLVLGIAAAVVPTKQ